MIKMVLVQIYLSDTTQNIDLQLQPAKYKVRFVSCQYNYATQGTNNALFPVQFRSSFTQPRYGNVRWLQVSQPANSHAQINGLIEWDAIYSGQFEMNVIDVSTMVAPEANRFSTCTLYFDVEKVED